MSPETQMSDVHEDPRTEVVFMTGSTRGIGRAIAEESLQTDRNVHVVNIGRSSGEDVRRNLKNEGVEEQFPETKSGERITYLDGVDLADEETVRATIQRYIAANRAHIKLVGIIYCAGEAVLCDDYDGANMLTKGRVDSMRKVNGDSVVAVAEEFANASMLNENTPFINVGSLAAYPNRAKVPGLGEYGAVKKDAFERIKQFFLERNIAAPVAEAFPGIYKTGMVFKNVDDRAQKGIADGFIDNKMTGLEFSGIVAAEALPGDPLIENIVNNVFAGKDAKTEIFGAHIPALYVKYCNYDFVRIFALPIFVMLFGKQTLEETGQTPAQHDERVEFHREKQSYGKWFPYSLVKHGMLWNAKISKWLTKFGRPHKLV